MRHGDKINNLGRTTAHRKALLSNLACQLIQYKRITTTLAKAKSLRMYVEPMITKSKSDTVNNRRLVFAKLQDKEAIKELFGAVSDKVASRPGGYTRIIKLAPRMGDAAEMAMIELVDFNTIYTKDAKAGTAKKTRRSRGGATKTAAPKAETTVATEEAPATEAPEQTKEEGAAE
jgi:large subunit ribosomal protein L17